MNGGSYFNTTRVRGRQLAEYEARAETQEEKVLEFAKHNPELEFTAEDVGRLILPGTPRTSWGRALTNLERRGALVRLDRQVEGSWGRPIYLYRLARPQAPREPIQKEIFG